MIALIIDALNLTLWSFLCIHIYLIISAVYKRKGKLQYNTTTNYILLFNTTKLQTGNSVKKLTLPSECCTHQEYPNCQGCHTVLSQIFFAFSKRKDSFLLQLWHSSATRHNIYSERYLHKPVFLHTSASSHPPAHGNFKILIDWNHC